MALHVVSDLLIFLSSMAVATTFAVMRFRYRKDIFMGSIFIAFGALFAACGLTYLMDVILFWKPLYSLAGDIKLVAALAAVLTATILPFLAPRLGRLLAKARTSKQNEQYFLAVSNSSSDSFYILQSVRNEAKKIVDFRFVFANSNGASLVSSTPAKLVGQLLSTIFPFNRTDGFFDRYTQVVHSGIPLTEEFPVESADVNATWLRHQIIKVDDGIAITATDISAKKHAEIKLGKTLAFSRSLIDNSPFPILALELDGTIREINPAAERMLEYTNEELAGRATPLILHDPDEVARRAAHLSHELGMTVLPDISVFTVHPSRGLIDRQEWTYIRKGGSHVIVEISVTALTDELQKVNGWLCVAYDITERKHTEEYISHLAHHDSLTGLPSRALLNDRMELALKRAHRNSSKVALMMVDIDNFKRVNDSLGHSVGDNLLISVAQRLQHTIRETDTVARMGGDEFIVLIDDVRSDEEAEKIAEKLVAVMAAPVTINGEQHPISASIGLCLYPEGGGDLDALLKNADEAMYFAKAEGRNMYQIFSKDMASATAKRRTIENALDCALSRNEFDVVYQPQISFQSGKVTGIEALIRWNSKLLGNVTPAEFIPVAEQTGLIVPIGEWVLRTACKDARRLEEKLGHGLTIAVNLSPRQFQQENLPEIVSDALAESGLEPKHLELEITENILVNDSRKAMRVLDRVRALGPRIAIDDFGTGFSSMSYILRFNVDRLKIDQSFIRNIMTEPNGAITRAIISLAKGLKINVVAEGVETAEMSEILLREGCDEAQGYFYSRPVAFGEIEEVIHRINLDASSRRR
ncbi:sensor domain-containing protein [Terriglobus saanensis]|uniref:sensor domain-containing protein n=1 Tax=Terriglobus saanensis TaxID=870903 RepID=UPI00032369B3|nr:EAL domain-containing protein [Terriglobus saanensis]